VFIKSIHIFNKNDFVFRTNLPKEIMELQGFPHKGPEDKSYVAANEMLKYLEDYADHFHLRKHIKVITNNIN
jgi:cation diffusion facilitator CzcD-associated flavoprotein CzcO